mmetsp:Transcript_45766/g.103604  ORF Transcript_45766/g.103604 Transcript_45766/m.103604 type:complete len:228 (+) Transcript_45766:894-1577(+)
MRFLIQNLHHHIPPTNHLHGNTPSLDDVALFDLFADFRKSHEHFHLPHQSSELSSAIESEIEGGTSQLVSEVVNVALQILKLLTGQQIALVVCPPTLVEIMKRNELLFQRLSPFLRRDDSLQYKAESVTKRYSHITDHSDHSLGVAVGDSLLQGILLRSHLILQLGQFLDDGLDGIGKLRLNLPLHELGEMVKPDHLLKLGRNIFLPHLGQIRCGALPQHLAKIAWA